MVVDKKSGIEVTIEKFLKHQSGASVIEYGLIAALFAVMVLVAVAALNDPVHGLFGSVVQSFQNIEHE